MRFYGYPEKIVRLLEKLYQETFSAVRVDGCLTDWFRTLIVLLHECVLSPILFNILLEKVMVRAAEGVKYLGAVISGYTISNLRFADDIATLAESSNDLQAMVSNMHGEGSTIGLHINAAKAETQCFTKQKQVIRLSIDNVSLQQVESCIYLGGKPTSNNNSSEDIVRRIELAMGVSRSIQTIWKAFKYHDRYESIALQSARPLNTLVQCRNVVPQGGRQTEAACIRDVHST